MADATRGPWTSTKELLSQIRDIRETAANPGYSLYSTSSFDKVRLPIGDSIEKYNAYYAFPPVMKGIDSIPPPAPVVKAIPSSGGTLLQWQQEKKDKQTVCYAVYRFIDNEPVNINKAENIIAVVQHTEYVDKAANKYKNVRYAVTAFDRLWNESIPSNIAYNTAE